MRLVAKEVHHVLEERNVTDWLFRVYVDSGCLRFRYGAKCLDLTVIEAVVSAEFVKPDLRIIDLVKFGQCPDSIVPPVFASALVTPAEE